MGLLKTLMRRKGQNASCVEAGSSSLARVLTTLDLTALGVGSTLGVGVYVLAGSVARDFAGPAVVVSFAVAALLSMFAGLCYAEFGARVPLAGSAYIYSYVTIGELMAFVMGWNLIMEYVIGCASVARGLSSYLDHLVGNAMQNSFAQVVVIDVDFLSPYVDFFAFGVSIVLSVILALGVRESMIVNNVFTLINICVVLFVIVIGSFKADISNWQINADIIKPDVSVNLGTGGFLPFGVMGVLRGASKCFYGFIGFDCIAASGEEVRNPQKAIPTAIISSLLIIFVAYCGVSSVLTLMWPYYLQDRDVPLPFVFSEIGWPVAQRIVAIGGVFGLIASLFGAMYPLPRIIYSMANDGLLFNFLGTVHPRYKTPLIGTLLGGLITGIMSAVFDLDQLVSMLALGTLMTYTIIAACVLLLRYREDSENAEYIESTNLVTLKASLRVSNPIALIFNWRSLNKYPTPGTSLLVAVEVIIFCALSFGLCLCLVILQDALLEGDQGALALVGIIGSLMLLVLLLISLQPTSSSILSFKVPLVPLVPALSIVMNMYIMFLFDAYTWIRYAIWMAVGLALYFITYTCRMRGHCCSTRFRQAPRSTDRLSLGPIKNGVPNQFQYKKNETSPVLRNGHLNFSTFAPVEIRLQCATPPLDRRPSEGSLDFVPTVPKENAVVHTTNASDTMVVEAVTVQGSSVEVVEDKCEVIVGEITDSSNDHKSEIDDPATNEEESQKQENLDSAPLSSISSELNNFGSVDEDLSVPTILITEDNNSECDVRSLYPDVVVVTPSSEEEVEEEDSLSHQCDELCGTVKVTPVHAMVQNIAMLDSEDKIYTVTETDVDDIPETRNDDNFEDSILKHIKIPPLPTTDKSGEEISVTRVEEDDDRPKSPFKNSAFIENLSKIIATQSADTLKRNSKMPPPLQKRKVSAVRPKIDSFVLNGSLTFENNNSEKSAGPNLTENHDKLNGSTEADPDETSNETNSTEDIKSKLERIFSNKDLRAPLNLSFGSALKITAKSDENKESRGSSNDVSKMNGEIPSAGKVSRDMIETKLRMNEVLGTLRLKVKPVAANNDDDSKDSTILHLQKNSCDSPDVEEISL